jgi:hypothetical protein
MMQGFVLDVIYWAEGGSVVECLPSIYEALDPSPVLRGGDTMQENFPQEV